MTHPLSAFANRRRAKAEVRRKRDVKRAAGKTQSHAFAELLIACEEDRTLRSVLVGMLREAG